MSKIVRILWVISRESIKVIFLGKNAINNVNI